MFFTGTFPDDGSGSDFHHSAVSDGIKTGNVKYDFLSDFPGTGYRVRYLSDETGIYGTSKGSGRSCQTGRM